MQRLRLHEYARLFVNKNLNKVTQNGLYPQMPEWVVQVCKAVEDFPNSGSSLFHMVFILGKIMKEFWDRDGRWSENL